MVDSTHDSDMILADAARVIPGQRMRREGSIGAHSRAMKARHWTRKLTRVALAIFAILIVWMVSGIVLNGIGLIGVMLLALTIAVVAAVLIAYPRLPVPTPATLRAADLATLAGKAEIWLEAQRAALPAPAIPLIDTIGTRLDQLAPQLARLDDNDPAAHDVRRLVGEHLPELIASYRRIPDALRRADHAGSTPEQQLLVGLRAIDRDIADMTRQIANGELDALATRSRYLAARGEGEGEADGLRLPQL